MSPRTASRIRTLIVDDEPPARARLRGALLRHPEFEVIGEAGDGPEALGRIRELMPDLVFLDIRMPGMDGFEVLRLLSPEEAPWVVFVTAYGDRALEAFQVHALDYLVKPFEEGRFNDMLRHVQASLGEGRNVGDESGEEPEGEGAGQGGAGAAEPGGNGHDEPPATRIQVRDGHRTLFLRVEEVRYLAADGNYVVVHTGDKEYRIRTPLRALARRLNPREFIRIHRSTVLRLGALREIQPWFSGDYLAILDDGTELRISRNYRDRILRQTL